MNTTYPAFHIATFIVHGRSDPESNAFEDGWRILIQTTCIGDESGIPALAERVRDVVNC